jgi:hypothetical protein
MPLKRIAAASRKKEARVRLPIIKRLGADPNQKFFLREHEFNAR